MRHSALFPTKSRPVQTLSRKIVYSYAVSLLPGYADSMKANCDNTMAEQRSSIKQAVLLILASLALTGCGAPWSQSADDWRGEHIEDLLRSWGPPASSYETLDGKKTVWYSNSWFSADAGKQYYCDVSFWTDSVGVISGHAINGDFGGCSRFFTVR